MTRSPDSPRTARIVGALFAAIWLCAGIAAMTVGTVSQRWLLIVLGALAVWYGVAWINVARLGRRITLREMLKPWRIASKSKIDT